MASTSTVMDVDVSRERDDEIKKLINITTIIIDEAGLSDTISKDIASNIIDIDISDELAGVLMTVFTCLRKEENDQTGHQRYLGYIATINKREVSIQTIVDKIKANNIKLNFLVSTPIVEIMTLFKGMFDEVRTGVTRFRVRKTVYKKGLKRDSTGKQLGRDIGEKETTQNITQYGLVNHHIPLLQGITLPPERRTGVLRSLGPLAQAILMVMEDKYFTKLNSALSTSLQMLPMASEIISCLKEANSPGSVSGVLKELGDILLITTARATQKIYFPLLLCLYLWDRKPNGFQWSFSGAPMLKLYTTAAKGMKFRIRSGASPLLTSEAIFHATFGTYLEDLSVLQQITTHPRFHQRKDMNSVFLKRGEKNSVLVTPIQFRYISKMAQALLTKSLGNIDPVSTSRPSFSGFRKRTFTQEFLSYLSTGKSAINYSSDPMQLQYALKKIKDSLVDEKDSEKVLNAGTKKWETQTTAGWVECDFIPTEGNIKFFGINA